MLVVDVCVYDYCIGGNVLYDICFVGGKVVIKCGLQQEVNVVFSGLYIVDIYILYEVYVVFFVCLCEIVCEFVDVVGGIGFCEIVVVVVVLQCGLDGGNVFGAYGVVFKFVGDKQGVGFVCCCKVCFVVIDVQNVVFLQIEIDLFMFSYGKQMFVGFDGYVCGFDGVVVVVCDVGYEFVDL